MKPTAKNFRQVLFISKCRWLVSSCFIVLSLLCLHDADNAVDYGSTGKKMTKRWVQVGLKINKVNKREAACPRSQSLCVTSAQWRLMGEQCWVFSVACERTTLFWQSLESHKLTLCLHQQTGQSQTKVAWYLCLKRSEKHSNISVNVQSPASRFQTFFLLNQSSFSLIHWFKVYWSDQMPLNKNNFQTVMVSLSIIPRKQIPVPRFYFLNNPQRLLWRRKSFSEFPVLCSCVVLYWLLLKPKVAESLIQHL